MDEEVFVSASQPGQRVLLAIIGREVNFGESEVPTVVFPLLGIVLLRVGACRGLSPPWTPMARKDRSAFKEVEQEGGTKDLLGRPGPYLP